jgi:hypothetical protein
LRSVHDEGIAFAFVHDVVRGKQKYEDNKSAHGRNILEKVDEGGAAIRCRAIHRPRSGAPQAIPEREAINGGRG